MAALLWIIVSTLGPASKSPEMLEKLFNAGVNVFRLNFSHGSYEDHKENFDNIRKLEKKLNKPIAILGDLQGPKLRVGKFKDDKVLLEVGLLYLGYSDAPKAEGKRNGTAAEKTSWIR